MSFGHVIMHCRKVTGEKNSPDRNANSYITRYAIMLHLIMWLRGRKKTRFNHGHTNKIPRNKVPQPLSTLTQRRIRDSMAPKLPWLPLSVPHDAAELHSLFCRVHTRPISHYVGPSVRRSVRRSVRPSVRPPLAFFAVTPECLMVLLWFFAWSQFKSV